MRRDLALAPDAISVFEALTLTREAGKPCADIWSDFCGHHATQDFGSREALLGRWQKWIGQQCVIAEKDRQRDRARCERDQGQRSGPRLVEAKQPYHAPFRPPKADEEPITPEAARAALRAAGLG